MQLSTQELHVFSAGYVLSFCFLLAEGLFDRSFKTLEGGESLVGEDRLVMQETKNPVITNNLSASFIKSAK